ncbi:MAG: hypothetical protein WCT29_02375 [Candidatus Paceibacterota bacterium]|jgi:hypothetical protein
MGRDSAPGSKEIDPKEEDAKIAHDAEQLMLENGDEEIQVAINKVKEEIERIPFNSYYRKEQRLQAKIRGFETILNNRKREKNRAAEGVDDVGKAEAMAYAMKPEMDNTNDRNRYMNLDFRRRHESFTMSKAEREEYEQLGRRFGGEGWGRGPSHLDNLQEKKWAEENAQEAAYVYDVEQSVADKSEADIASEMNGLKEELQKLGKEDDKYLRAEDGTRRVMEREGFNREEAVRRMEQMSKRRWTLEKIAEKRKVERLSKGIKDKMQ